MPRSTADALALCAPPGRTGAPASGPLPAGAQVPQPAPAGTPSNALRLIGATAAGRVYVTGRGERMRIESADGRLAYTLPTVPDHAHQQAKDAFASRARELAGEVDTRGAGTPQWSGHPVDMRPGKAPQYKRFRPAGYAPGAMLAWTVAAVAYTGQVWANRVRPGAWNGWRGTASAVVVATVGGRRARRDEAVCLPLLHGARHPRAVVVTAGGNAEVEVIAPHRACDGLFDVITTAGDPVEDWEAEGGCVPDAGPADAVEELTDDVEPPPADESGDAPAAPAGKHCPRCERSALYGIECSYCGHIIITALTVKPCHPPAWSQGCCPTCFTTDPEVWEISGRLQCTVCAQGRSRWGAQVKAGPGWRERSRRVVAWTHNPGELAYATAYEDAPGAAETALTDVVSPL